MKLTSKILLLICMSLVAGSIVCIMLLKKQYDQIEKSDIYWTYDKVLSQPFKHLKIEGGNGTIIVYQPSNSPSVRLLRDWVSHQGGHIDAKTKDDTLFINFDFKPDNAFRRVWLKQSTTVRLFSPELLSVTGKNTNLVMERLRQKTISVDIKGRSKLQIESIFQSLDSIHISQQDTSAVVFKMSQDWRSADAGPKPSGKLQFHNDLGVPVVFPNPSNDFTENMSITSITANIKGYSILDVGHAQVKQLHVSVSDSSAIVLSGTALKLMKQ